MSRKESTRRGHPVETEFVVFPSRSGKRIVGCVDRPQGAPGEERWIVVTPKFGESKKNSLQLAWQLACNGLSVLRFDHSDHVGESDGVIEDYTFSGAVGDILSALDFLELQHGVASVQLLANSLSARCAIRVAAQDPRVWRLVTIVGVVNFRSTAREVYQRDMVGEFMEDKVQGISDILGHQVDVDQFLRDCVAANLHDLSGTLEDVRRARCEMYFFNADRDVWVDFGEVERLRDSSDLVTVSNISGAMHELRESPEAAEEAVRAVVRLCAFDGAGEPAGVAAPDRAALFAQNRVERERLRQAAPLRESERDFWKNYLHKYNILEAVGDYQEYLGLIGQCLGGPEPGRIYFDCGCGNGMFGAWCLRDFHARAAAPPAPAPAPVYFGLDLTAKGLSDAESKHRDAGRVIGDGGRGGFHLMYLRFDLDGIDPDGRGGASLPFADGAVDRICCSLLISYLKRPDFLLRELHRVLKPDGIIVVSSMKPFCDLSLIYKDVVGETEQEETLQSARNLLSAAGAIKLKEEEGHYKFYEKEELVEVVAAAGFKRIKPYRSFGDQANLVCAEK
jgi:SAM-dependent methyltransferase